MPDPTIPDSTDSLSSAGTDTGLTDDNFNRRLTVGLVVSFVVNIALFQGAGVMAKNMSLNSTDEQNVTVAILPPHARPTPTPSPSPTATPQPTPSPKQHRTPPTPEPPKHEVKPTPRPTPHIEKVKPTLIPTPPALKERIKPTPPPVQPIKDITPKIPTPPPTEHQTTKTEAIAAREKLKTQEVSPAIAMTPTNPLMIQNHTAAKGMPAHSLMSSTLSARSSASSTRFAVPTLQAAPVPKVPDLPSRSLMGAVSAAFNHTTSAQVQENALPTVETNNLSASTSQAITHSGHIAPATARMAVMTRTNPAQPAQPTFVVPAGGVAPGHLGIQGNSPGAHTAAQFASSGATSIQAGSVEAVVSVPGQSDNAPAGVYHQGRMMSRQISALPAEARSHTPGGGTFANSMNAGIGAGGNTASHLSASRVGNATAAFSANGVYNPNAQGDGGVGIRTGTSGAGMGASLHQGPVGKARGQAADSIGPGRTGGGAGPVGVSDGALGGSGNGSGLRVGVRNGGVATGIGSGSNVGSYKGSGDVEIRASAGGGGGTPIQVKTPDDVEYHQVAATHGPVTSQPARLVIPESLKSQVIDTSVTVRVTFLASGQLRARITKTSGYADLDNEAINCCKAIKFKPAAENGSPIDSSNDYTFHVNNKG